MDTDKPEVPEKASVSNQWDYRVVLSLAAFTAASSTYYAVYKLGYQNGKEATEAIYSQWVISGVSFSEFINAWHFAIATALIIGAVGIWSRRGAGLLASGFAFIGVAAAYIWWYVKSLAYLRSFEVKSFSELSGVEHIGGLVGAVWWDVVVLVVTLMLFVWTLKVVIGFKLLSRHGS